MIKSLRVRWEGNVAFTGDERTAYGVLVEKPEGNIML
jgi:hypothetical protein